jgi:type II secretory pathway component PulK
MVVPLLALGAYSFTHLMRAESRASQVVQRQAQARWQALSGIAYVRSLLAQPESYDPTVLDLADNPTQFAAQLVYTEPSGAQGMFTIITSESAESTDAIRYGLTDECSKIPLHNQTLVQALTRDMLLGLPDMTEEIADCILDWLDSDDEPRELGAEATYYALLDPPYRPRNGAPKTLGELLLVKGVTPRLLFGEDANLDGALNPNEDDGEASYPPDDADGALDRGWLPFLTLYSAAVNVTPQGEAKLNLNDGDVNDQSKASEFHSRLASLFGEELTTFVIEYRKKNGEIKKISDLIDATVEIQQNAGGTQGNQQEAAAPQGQQRAAAAAPLTRGGDTLSVQSSAMQQPKTITLKSPWRSDNVRDYLETALEELTVSKETMQPGQIDVSKAPAAVLRALPKMTEELAEQIATAGAQRSSDSPTPAWLLVDGLVTLEQFKELEPQLTGTGRVFRFESVGFFDRTGPVVRIEVLLDATDSIPKVIQRQDLTPTYNGYSLAVLTNGAITQ